MVSGISTIYVALANVCGMGWYGSALCQRIQTQQWNFDVMVMVMVGIRKVMR